MCAMFSVLGEADLQSGVRALGLGSLFRRRRPVPVEICEHGRWRPKGLRYGHANFIEDVCPHLQVCKHHHRLATLNARQTVIAGLRWKIRIFNEILEGATASKQTLPHRICHGMLQLRRLEL
jgi:hypothetical protein